ncbi:hypothetical protein AAKU52_003185, partial [Pedobacter sp. CG_S7]
YGGVARGHKYQSLSKYKDKFLASAHNIWH